MHRSTNLQTGINTSGCKGDTRTTGLINARVGIRPFSPHLILALPGLDGGCISKDELKSVTNILCIAKSVGTAQESLQGRIPNHRSTWVEIIADPKWFPPGNITMMRVQLCLCAVFRVHPSQIILFYALAAWVFFSLNPQTGTMSGLLPKPIVFQHY